MKKLVLKRQSYNNQEVSEGKAYKIDYKNLLNEQQYAAITHNKGAALVLAGAGTGKTRILIYRLSRLIEDGVKPESILLLTFTRKSAMEMISRASAVLDNRAEKINGGTYHSFCLQILKKYAPLVGYNSNFNVIDTDDALELVSIARQEILNKNKSKTKTKFPAKNVLARLFSNFVNKGDSFTEILRAESEYLLELKEQIEAIYVEFIALKRSSNVMDYDDLLLKTRELLKNHKKAYYDITSQYQYIMVDEYQDTNRIQHELVMLLGGDSSNIMVVGDDAQSIYSFRGAEYQNILFFPNNFNDCKTYLIEQNYRSTNEILHFANDVLSKSNIGYAKKLFSEKEAGDSAKLIIAKNENDQSQFVVQTVLSHLEDGVSLNEMAVLFRNSAHSFDLEFELNKASIPYIKFGGLKFMDSAHIRDVIAYIRVLGNPKDITAWSRVLKFEDRIGAKTSLKIINDIQLSKKAELSELLKELEQSENGKILQKLITSLNKTFEKGELVAKIQSLLSHYRPHFENTYKDYKTREDDLDLFMTMIARYNSIDNLLSELSLNPPQNVVQEISSVENKESDFLTLSTVHSAKGLEWKIVFIIWAVEGYIPSERSSYNTDALEEERRLFYVAVTRAKEQLYITAPTIYSERFNGYIQNRISQFIEETPEEILEKFILDFD